MAYEDSHNPLIDERDPAFTLDHVAAVLAYFQDVQPVDGGTLSDSGAFGQSLIMRTLVDAVRRESDRVRHAVRNPADLLAERGPRQEATPCSTDPGSGRTFDTAEPGSTRNPMIDASSAVCTLENIGAVLRYLSYRAPWLSDATMDEDDELAICLIHRTLAEAANFEMERAQRMARAAVQAASDDAAGDRHEDGGAD